MLSWIRRMFGGFATILLILLCGAAVADDVIELCPSVCVCLGSHVDCSRLQLTNVPVDIPSWAETLELQGNGHLPSILTSSQFQRVLPNLKKLDLSGCLLDSIEPATFEKFPELITIVLRKNRLSAVPNGLRSLTQLRKLDLRANALTSLSSEALEAVQHVEFIDFSRNKISDWPIGGFPTSATVKRLHIDNNKITELPDGSLSSLRQLKELKISRNKIRHITRSTFLHLDQLELLDLSKNKIRHLESLTFRNLSELRTLRLNRNGIRTIDDGAFWGLDQLNELILANNKLNLLKQGTIYGLTELKKLDVSHNEISRIEADIWKASKELEIVNLSHNRLSLLPERFFTNLRSLKELYLAHNAIAIVHSSSFEGLRRLLTLDLSGNRLSTAIEDSQQFLSSGLSSLNTLMLAANGIKSLPADTFVRLPKLIVLDLSDNQIAAIHRDAFDSAIKLQELEINSSSLLCDCQLDWVSGWLQEHRLQYGDRLQLVCDHPPSLQGVNLFDVPPDSMTCGNSPKPKIVDHPTDVTGLSGNNATFKCTATVRGHTDDINVEWKRGSTVLYTDEGSLEIHTTQLLDESGQTKFETELKIFGLRDEDKDRYQCVLTNRFGSAYSRRAELTVYVVPSFVKRPTNLTLEPGRNAKLECTAVGDPVPVIRWDKDEGAVFPAALERRLHVNNGDDVFYIVNVKPQDTGRYTCHATSSAGAIAAVATLTVLERPRLEHPLTNKSVVVGENAVLDCMTEGQPKPDVQWFHNGVLLSAGRRISMNAKGQLLVIVGVGKQDVGTYTCRISNPLATVQFSAQLTVTEDLNAAKVNDGKSSTVAPVSTTPNSTDEAVSMETSLVLWLRQWLPYDLLSPAGIAISVVVLSVFLASCLWLIIICCRFRSAREKTKNGRRKRQSPPAVYSYDEASCMEISPPIGTYYHNGPVEATSTPRGFRHCSPDNTSVGAANLMAFTSSAGGSPMVHYGVLASPTGVTVIDASRQQLRHYADVADGGGSRRGSTTASSTLNRTQSPPNGNGDPASSLDSGMGPEVQHPLLGGDRQRRVNTRSDSNSMPNSCYYDGGTVGEREDVDCGETTLMTTSFPTYTMSTFGRSPQSRCIADCQTVAAVRTS